MDQSFVESRYLQNDSILAVAYIENNQATFTAEIDGFDALVLVITDSETRFWSTHHYIRDEQYIQERWCDRLSFEEFLKSASIRDIQQWLFNGEILLDPKKFLEEHKERFQKISSEMQEKKLLEEFARLLRHYSYSKNYLIEGDILDAYSHILTAMHHWAKISVIEQGLVPDSTIWKQVKRLNPAIFKLYEELTIGHETLEQRIRLAHLACDFSVVSKLDTCCRPLLRILSSRTEPWSAAELEGHPELKSMRPELNLLLKKLVLKSLIREVLVSTDAGLDMLELRYTS